MKRKTNWFDRLINNVIRLALTAGFILIMVVTVSGTEFTIVKKKSSILVDLGNIADGTLGLTRTIKNFVK